MRSKVLLCVSALLVVTSFVVPALLRADETPAKAKSAVFVFADRTDRHAKYSSSEVFHSLLDDTLAFLKDNRVVIAVDDFGGRTFSENVTPIDTIMTMARDAHATSVLHFNVDRPVTKWMKVTVRCYDMQGKLLWEDKAESGGGFSGEHGLRVCKEKLRELLKKKLGQDGVPVLTASAAEVEPNAKEGRR